MALTKFFRVAVEGDTVDGRKIERRHIQEAADSYNPATYTANINVEHLRGFSPNPPFNNYGHVAAAKAQEDEIEIAGKKEKRLALYAQFDVNDQAKQINAAGQKMFSSMEITSNFANSGKAYLIGLGLTDIPASIATEMLKFSRDESRKDNLRAVEEITLEFEDAGAPDEVKGLFSSLTSMFDAFTKKAETKTETVVTPPQPQNEPQGDDPLTKFAAQMSDGLGKLSQAVDAAFSAQTAQVTKLSTDLAALKQSMDRTTDPNHRQRQPADGSSYSMDQVF